MIIAEQKQLGGFIELELSDKVFEGVQMSKVQDEKGDVYITIIDGQHRIRGIEIALEKIEQDIHICITNTSEKSKK